MLINHMQAGNRFIADQHQRGFTLMELLVVIVVISIAFTMLITLAVPGGGPADAIRKEGLRLQQLLSAAHEQAVFRAEEYGVYFDDDSYRFMQLDMQKNIWTDIEKDKLFRKRDLPEDMRLDLNIEEIDVIFTQQENTSSLNTEEDQLKPQVFLLSSGETTPEFTARIRIPGFDRSFEVTGSINGIYELQETD
ncbi:MAG: type II secretion system minor pseudopilin GspH [Gammaproteobacteria bacterium]|nr:type II secretion system minor pseudopilin GspH [Gammaproteobacteria bacterium]